MPPWHPWAFWVICKLGRPLPKFHFFGPSSLEIWDKRMKVWCLHLGFQGIWFWLGHCQNDQIICICINMQIRGSVCPKCIKPKLLGMENIIQVENTASQLSETAYQESNFHVTDDVTWSQKVKAVTPKSLKLNISSKLLLKHTPELVLYTSVSYLKTETF